VKEAIGGKISDGWYGHWPWFAGQSGRSPVVQRTHQRAVQCAETYTLQDTARAALNSLTQPQLHRFLSAHR
jgi:hypothetical protein